MENDNSSLAGGCHQWGFQDGSYEVSKWGHARDQGRLYDHAAFVKGSYHWLLTPGGSRWECDDHLVGVSSGDFWKVFVRKVLGTVIPKDVSLSMLKIRK